MTKKNTHVRRDCGKSSTSDGGGLLPRRPPVAVLLEADRRHRRRVRAAERHGNPLRATLATASVLRTPVGKWRFIACHEGDVERVAVYYRGPGRRSLGRRFVTTAKRGPLQGKRVVRGRAAECLKLYRVGQQQGSAATVLQAAPYAAPAALALLMIPFANVLTDDANADELRHAVTTAIEAPAVDVQTVARPATADTEWYAASPADPPVSTHSAVALETIKKAEIKKAHTETNTSKEHNASSWVQRSHAVTHADTSATAETASPSVVPPPPVVVASEVKPAAESVLAAEPAQQARTDDVQREAALPRPGPGYTNVWVQTPSESAADTRPALALSTSASDHDDNTFPLSLDTAYNEYRNASPGVRFDPEQHDAYWQMNVKSLIADKLQITGRVAFSSFDPESEDGFGDDQYRAMRFGLQSTQGALRYGTRYRSAGKEFVKHKKDKTKFKEDRETWETWGAKQFGNFNIRTAFIQEENNLQGDPKKPRLTDQETRVTLSHALSHWPSYGYSFSYGTGTRASSDEPAGYAAFRGPMERLGASLYYASDHWNASLSSYQITARDDQVGGRGSTIRGHSLSGSYYPTKNFSISPWLGITDEYYESDQSHTDGAYVGLALSQAIPHKRLRLNAYGSYYSDRNPIWDYDTDGVYAEASMVWSLNKRAQKPQSVGLHVTYNRYRDHVFSDSSTDDTAVWLIYRFNSGSLPFRRLDDFSPFR